MSRRTISTSMRSIGSPGISPPRRARGSSAPHTPGSSERSAPAGAGREPRAAARDGRRRQLLRKELAWLRRGPPARTSKPKFRIEAANALIADEPEPRDRAELLRFAARRLGDKVLEAEDVTLSYENGRKPLLRRVTWRLGPGERVRLGAVNGSGKTSLIRILEGTQAPDGGRVDRGQTVRVAHLSQDT